MIALEKGRIVQQGTLKTVAESGYDLTGSLSGLASHSSTDPSGSKAGEADNKNATEKSKKETRDEEDEKQDEDDGLEDMTPIPGLLPYKFYAHEAGYLGTITTLLLFLMTPAMKLGIQVSTSPCLLLSSNSDR